MLFAGQRHRAVAGAPVAGEHFRDAQLGVGIAVAGMQAVEPSLTYTVAAVGTTIGTVGVASLTNAGGTANGAWAAARYSADDLSLPKSEAAAVSTSGTIFATCASCVR